MKRKQKYMAAFLVLILIQLTLGSFITKTDAKEVITTRIIHYTQGTRPTETGKINVPNQPEIPSQSNKTDQLTETGQTEEAVKNDSPEQTVESKEEEQKEESGEEKQKEESKEEKQIEEPGEEELKEEEPEEEQEGDTKEAFPKEYTGNIILDVKELSLNQGDTYQLKATLTEDNKTESKLSYKTNNKKILTVTQKGVIKALHWGEATVTVSLGVK